MEKMTIEERPPCKRIMMRKVSEQEQRLGLWLDRTGTAWETPFKRSMRLLGQYGYVEVLEGSGHFFSPPTGWHSLNKGDCVLLFPDVPHYYDPTVKWHTRWLVFDGLLAKTYQDFGLLDPKAPIQTDVHYLANEIFLKLERYTRMDQLTRAAANFATIAELILLCHHRSESPILSQDFPIEQIEHYVRENCGHGMTPEKIAQGVNIGYSNLRRLFKTHTGKSVKQYITEERISAAETLLHDTSLPPKQIADIVGYPDYLYFMRVFKKVTGMTVGDFRKS